MKPPIPLCCSPHAFAMMVRQSSAINSPDALLEGALAIAAHQIPVDTGEVDRILQSYADTIRARVRGTQQQALLAHLHEYLFDELGFAGNTDDYYNPENSYLPCVLKTKRGLPIASRSSTKPSPNASASAASASDSPATSSSPSNPTAHSYSWIPSITAAQSPPTKPTTACTKPSVMKSNGPMNSLSPSAISTGSPASCRIFCTSSAPTANTTTSPPCSKWK